MKQRAEITFETEETLMLRLGGNLQKLYCERCGRIADMIPPWILAAIAGVGERKIFRLIESGWLDCTENGRVLVCPDCFANINKEI